MKVVSKMQKACLPIRWFNFRHTLKTCLLLLVVSILSACGSTITKTGGDTSASSQNKQSESRYSIKQDKAPAQHRDMSNAPDAVPRAEAHSRGGNKSVYEVWGKQYYVLPSSQGFREQGIASWYGEKFHGHLTSNGETYDMFSMTAAHKHLPLPTYVRITNLENNRVVIVRVNDRGPFHGNRVIDLSYAAASKLGYHKKGVAKVLVEAIDGSSWNPAAEQALRRQRQLIGTNQWSVNANADNSAVSNVNNAVALAPATSVTKASPVSLKIDNQITHQEQRPLGYFVQLGAFSQMGSAKKIAEDVTKKLVRADVHVEKSTNGQLYRVLIGPVRDEKSTAIVLQKVTNLGYGSAIVLKP